METIIVLPEDGLSETSNVLDKKYLLAALEVHETVVGIDVPEDNDAFDGDEDDDGTMDFDSLCLRAQDSCVQSSVLSLVWNNNRTALEADTDVLGSINARMSDALLATIGGTEFGSAVNGTRPIVSARALRLQYFLENRNQVINGKDVDFAGEKFEEAVEILWCFFFSPF